MKPLFSIEAFADWVEKKPGSATYFYSDGGDCAYCQYLRDVGLPVEFIGIDIWKNALTCEYRQIPNWVDPAVKAKPWTFGALAARLRSSH